MSALRTLKRPRFVPPGGAWFYCIPGTDIRIESQQGVPDVEQQVVRYYRANKMPVPENLAALIEDFICSQMPAGVCYGSDTRASYEIVPNFFEVNHAMEERFRGKKIAYAEPLDAARRIKVCCGCPKDSLRLCTSCDGLRDTARRFVGGRSTRQDGMTGVCMVYRIPVSALVWIHALEPAEGMPSNCWVSHG